MLGRRLLPLTLLALGLSAPAAPAAELLPATSVSVAKAVTRTCHDRLVAPGTAGTVRRLVTTDANGLVRARLTGPAASDWDLAVFDAVSRRLVAGSAHFGSAELAEGVVRGGQALAVQACRRTGRARRVRVDVRNVALPAVRPGALKIVRIQLPNQAAEDLLHTLDLDLTEHQRPGFADVLLHSASDLLRLQRSGLAFDVVVPDVIAADRAALRTRLGPPDGTMPSGRVAYRRLPEFGEDMKKLVADNPTLVKPITLPEPTLEGRPVEGIEITRDVAAADGKPIFLQLGIHHAREWPSAEMAIEFAFELVNKFNARDERVTGLLDKARVIVVPIVNSDGFNLSREAPVDTTTPLLDLDFAYKRKNCRVNDGALPAPGECGLDSNRAAGVDPNRNYGAFWGGPGASASLTSDTYRGAAPFSEPETRNVRALVSARQVTTLITNHTYSDLILRPPGLQSQPAPPDAALYKELSDAMAAENGYQSIPGYELYDTTGTTEDWSYNATGGLGFTFEIGPAYKDFNVVGTGFHPAYPVGVVAEWFGKIPTGGGNREAYYLALESTANAARHSIIEGRGPAGATIRLRKSFRTATSRPEEGAAYPDVADELNSSMTIPAGGAFEYHVNPSTRPAAALLGQTESWKLTCEAADGRILGRHDVVVARGERAAIGEACAAPETAAPPATSALGLTVASVRGTLRRGLPVRVTCSRACDVSVRLTADKRTAKRLKVRGTTIASASRRNVASSAVIRLKASRKVAAALARNRRATLTLAVTAVAADGARATVLRTLRVR